MPAGASMAPSLSSRDLQLADSTNSILRSDIQWLLARGRLQPASSATVVRNVLIGNREKETSTNPAQNVIKKIKKEPGLWESRAFVCQVPAMYTVEYNSQGAQGASGRGNRGDF